MRSTTILICSLAMAALAGCSHQSVSVPNYHTLIVLSSTDASNAARKHAEMMCNEAGTPESSDASPWCGAVNKAEKCERSWRWTKGVAANETAAGFVTLVEANPTPECPPK